MVTMELMSNRTEWLSRRMKTIGGSEAAAVIGLSPWMNNTELYDLKRNQTPPVEHLNENPAVIYGTQAEVFLRRLFELDYPEQSVTYRPNNIFFNDKYPWAHASLDGWLEDPKGRRGVLEIKTANIMSAMQARKWNNAIPDHYFAQVLHEMAVYDADYAVVKAQLKRGTGEEMHLETKHYWIEREDFEESIENLMALEQEFMRKVKTGERPVRILPEI